MKETIKFYYKGELKGEAPLPEGTMIVDRHNIAKSIGVKIYDRMQFCAENGEVRVDSNDISPQTLFNKEFNIEL
jgi:hypothetical protein